MLSLDHIHSRSDIEDEKMEKTNLTYENRLIIENGIEKRLSFASIAKQIGKDRSTISREVKRNRTCDMGTAPRGSIKCRHLNEGCRMNHYCGTCIRKDCHGCKKICGVQCPFYEPAPCEHLLKPPYVCNKCRKRLVCDRDKYFYWAKKAQQKYTQMLTTSRQGVNLTPEEHERLDHIVRDGIARGLSPYQIICHNGGEEGLGICEKTFYSYINDGVFAGIGRGDTRARPYKKRKTGPERTYKKDKRCLEGRRYEDYVSYMGGFSPEEEPHTVQIDTVMGRLNSDDDCLLTIFFTSCSLQLAFVRRRNTCESVAKAFEWIYERLGHDDFCRIFPLLLTDNGSEFTDPDSIELAPNGEYRTRLFYTHPYSSFEKGACERNHELIRYIVPKGTELKMTQKQARLMMSHINSLPRKSLGGLSPYDVFAAQYGMRILERLGIWKVPADQINITPDLLRD